MRCGLLCVLWLCPDQLFPWRLSAAVARSTMRGSFAHPQKKAVAPSSRSKGQQQLVPANATAAAVAPAPPALTVRRAVLSDGDALQRLTEPQSLRQREFIIRAFGATRIHTIM